MIIKNAQRGITSWPFRQKVYGTLEVILGLGRLPFQHRDNSQAPEDFSGTGDSRQAFPQSLFGAADIIFAEFHESQREAILVVVRISANGFLEDFFGAGRFAEMRVDVADQRQVSIILLARRRNLLGGFKRLRIEAFAEISVGQIKFHVIRIRIGTQGRLEMLDGVVIQTVSSKQNTHPGLRAVVARADLVKPRNCFSRIFEFGQLQISLG